MKRERVHAKQILRQEERVNGWVQRLFEEGSQPGALVILEGKKYPPKTRLEVMSETEEECNKFILEEEHAIVKAIRKNQIVPYY